MRTILFSNTRNQQWSPSKVILALRARRLGIPFKFHAAVQNLARNCDHLSVLSRDVYLIAWSNRLFGATIKTAPRHGIGLALLTMAHSRTRSREFFNSNGRESFIEGGQHLRAKFELIRLLSGAMTMNYAGTMSERFNRGQMIYVAPPTAPMAVRVSLR